MQEQTIDAVLDGQNCVVLAPTAGGKTEAAFFPLLSRMDSEDWPPVSVIYVAPIRALLNNQEERLQQYAELIGRRAFKWHGDVTPAAKKSFIDDPADILLTTPESLEAMLMSAPRARRRGCSAACAPSSSTRSTPSSATTAVPTCRPCSSASAASAAATSSASACPPPSAIPTTSSRWVAGSSKRGGIVVDPGGGKTTPELKLDYVASLENAARVIASLHPGEKRLVFVDSRRRVEALGQALRDQGVDTYVTHSSLSADERAAAEHAFEQGPNCVIVATSALELGIDVGDLDHVIQIDAPDTVAAFLQRMGRTGRRGGPPELHASSPPTTTASCAPPRSSSSTPKASSNPSPCPPVPRTYSPISSWPSASNTKAASPPPTGGPGSSAATPFRDLTADDRRELVDHMLEAGILAQTGGRLSLGDRGERLYGRRNFAELYAVFSTPQILKVFFGRDEIGSIDAYFAQQERSDDLSFVLGAKAWRAIDINWKEGVVRVEPIGQSKLPRWQGAPTSSGRQLCQAIRQILTTRDTSPVWSRRATQRLTELRAEYDLDPDHILDLVPDAYGLRLWTFAGGRANNILGRVLESKLGEKITLDNLYIGFRDRAAQSDAAIRQALAELREEGRPNRADALRFAETCARGRLSKFQPCLPERLEAEFFAQMLTDPDEAREAIAVRH